MKRSLIFLWENYGPMHVDRVNSVSAQLGADRKVIGVQFHSKSEVYGWASEHICNFEMITLFDNHDRAGALRKFARLIRLLFNIPNGIFFVCHHERVEILIFSAIIRLIGREVYISFDSKFDDLRRNIWKELLKRIFIIPYCGAIAGGIRSVDYLRMLGLRDDRIYLGSDAISVDWWRSRGLLSGPPSASAAVGRPFVCIARFIREKNLPMLIEAYAFYRGMVDSPRDLELCGSGVLEQELRDRVKQLGLEGSIHFRGFLQRDELVEILPRSLALILPSVQETFGCVIAEALACGIPVILSEKCGARDVLVRSGVNGFVIEPDNPRGLAFFMALLCQDPVLWARMAEAAWKSADAGDVARFVEAVAAHTKKADP